jgi:hypothetical protein
MAEAQLGCGETMMLNVRKDVLVMRDGDYMHLFKTRCDFTFSGRGIPPHPDCTYPALKGVKYYAETTG